MRFFYVWMFLAVLFIFFIALVYSAESPPTKELLEERQRRIAAEMQVMQMQIQVINEQFPKLAKEKEQVDQQLKAFEEKKATK